MRVQIPSLVKSDRESATSGSKKKKLAIPKGTVLCFFAQVAQSYYRHAF
jgi:hypothetical protein